MYHIRLSLRYTVLMYLMPWIDFSDISLMFDSAISQMVYAGGTL